MNRDNSLREEFTIIEKQPVENRTSTAPDPDRVGNCYRLVVHLVLGNLCSSGSECCCYDKVVRVTHV